MSSLRVMVKRSRVKKQQDETEKQQHLIVTENNLFKILLQKIFEIMTRSRNKRGGIGEIFGSQNASSEILRKI